MTSTCLFNFFRSSPSSPFLSFYYNPLSYLSAFFLCSVLIKFLSSRRSELHSFSPFPVFITGASKRLICTVRSLLTWLQAIVLTVRDSHNIWSDADTGVWVKHWAPSGGSHLSTSQCVSQEEKMSICPLLWRGVVWKRTLDAFATLLRRDVTWNWTFAYRFASSF